MFLRVHISGRLYNCTCTWMHVRNDKTERRNALQLLVPSDDAQSSSDRCHLPCLNLNSPGCGLSNSLGTNGICQPTSNLFFTSVSAITKGFKCSRSLATLLLLLFHMNNLHYICWSVFILHKQDLNSFLCATVDPYTPVMYCWCVIVPLLLQGCWSLFKGFSFLMLGYRGEQMETDILSSLIQHMYCNYFFWQRSITYTHCSRSATNVFKSNLMNF